MTHERLSVLSPSATARPGPSSCAFWLHRCIYNGLVRLRNEVKNAWSQIDVQLKRRYDLIPNLVETVKGYAVPRATDAGGGDPGPAAGDQRSARRHRVIDAGPRPRTCSRSTLRSLFAVSESYPDLKANRTSWPCRKS